MLPPGASSSCRGGAARSSVSALDRRAHRSSCSCTAGRRRRRSTGVPASRRWPTASGSSPSTTAATDAACAAVQPFRLEDCADDIAALLAALGVDRCIAVGYSMGGPIAQLLWQRHPHLVDGLVPVRDRGDVPRDHRESGALRDGDRLGASSPGPCSRDRSPWRRRRRSGMGGGPSLIVVGARRDRRTRLDPDRPGRSGDLPLRLAAVDARHVRPDGRHRHLRRRCRAPSGGSSPSPGRSLERRARRRRRARCLHGRAGALRPRPRRRLRGGRQTHTHRRHTGARSLGRMTQVLRRGRSPGRATTLMPLCIVLVGVKDVVRARRSVCRWWFKGRSRRSRATSSVTS